VVIFSFNLPKVPWNLLKLEHYIFSQSSGEIKNDKLWKNCAIKMPKILHCDNVKNGIELFSSTERAVTYLEKNIRVI
jgi:hypothetical protein